MRNGSVHKNVGVNSQKVIKIVEMLKMEISKLMGKNCHE